MITFFDFDKLLVIRISQFLYYIKILKIKIPCLTPFSLTINNSLQNHKKINSSILYYSMKKND